MPAGSARVIAAGTVGTPAERSEALALIDGYLATETVVISDAVPLALIWLGQPERALAIAQEKLTRNDTLFLPSLWTSAGRHARVLPQFAAFAQRIGLAESWHESGPPEFCRKSESGGYICE